MRQGQQHRRGRGRQNNNNQNNGHRKGGQNPLTRSFESNGPEVKVRGTPAHIAEKYLQLARDAQSSGDHVLAENYLQHAEHYNRIILAYREQQMQQSGEMMNGGGQRPFNPRHEGQEGDDAGGEDVSPHDDGASGDQPMLGRHSPGDPARGDMQPSFDDGRPQQRHGDHPRFRDRPQRHDRQDRHDRHERHDRQDRPDQRGDSFERPERPFDRQRERPHYQGPSRDTEQPAGEIREPRHLPREPREPRELREPREARERDALPIEPSLPPVIAEGPPVERPEAAPRRRERFGLGADQPDFLRRPVRRPRREPEAGFTPEVAPPPADDTPRE
ncbi:MAG: DUF4167 domain-containing protein [Hyphomicrobiaceae bacterium]|nr:DUF4167 domain-containing protein [Hyphomicrobiaceae bacterium]